MALVFCLPIPKHIFAETRIVVRRGGGEGGLVCRVRGSTVLRQIGK